MNVAPVNEAAIDVAICLAQLCCGVLVCQYWWCANAKYVELL